MKKTKKRDTALIIVLFVAYAVLQYILQISNRSASLGVYKGAIAAVQYGICLSMMLINQKQGRKVAITLLCLNIISMTAAVARGNREAIPGLFNNFFYIVTLILIARYNIRRERESRTDFITGVVNRKGLYIELQDKIKKNKEFSIIYISLNDFKTINDTYGHAYGDELLRKITQRISIKCGANCILARVGGAEFVVAIDNRNDLQTVADQLLGAIREKSILVVEDNSVECYVDGFAGVASFPKDASDYESIIKYADIAMTEALAQKSKQAYMFNSDMLARTNRQVQLGKLIKEGIVNDDFYLVYQPQYSMEKKLRGFETLLRLTTADGEMISPGEFIPVAEKSDLIVQIDDYVIERAMREFIDIIRQRPDLTLSINVSAKNFAEKGFVEKIKSSLVETEFPASNLEIEITEYCMVNSMDVTIYNISELRALGVQIALDDFGTGYTSLNYVASLPIDLLKIDKSLIDDIENDSKRRDFVKAVITMGQLMECEVISEGVENDSQIECLKEEGCDFVQGFVWGRPLMYNDAKKLTMSVDDAL